jgi:hypothetical protein
LLGGSWRGAFATYRVNPSIMRSAILRLFLSSIIMWVTLSIPRLIELDVVGACGAEIFGVPPMDPPPRSL